VDHPITLRPGGPHDVPGALAAWAAAIEGRSGQPVAPERRERTRAALGHPDGFLTVAVEPAGRIVGMALGTQALADDGAGPPVPGHCHVSAVFVRPEWWGRGLGGRLVDAVLAEALGRGYRTVQLWTQADNERALRLYASRGFVRSGRSQELDGELIVHLTADRIVPGRDPGSVAGTGPGVAGRAEG
jgi:ribosomal protein S18 acetylase RimI-like enzyme